MSQQRFYRQLIEKSQNARFKAHLAETKVKERTWLDHSTQRSLNSPPLGGEKKVEARAAELIAEEMSLRELRRAMGKTQAKVAADLGVGQDSVARYEQRTDMLISTLSEFIHKVGGTRLN